jgi:long-subunit acyl-CoA synthetase (AMP-forming)
VKLSHGEYISLARVETALLSHKLVDNVCLYADSDQSSAVALIVPNEKELKEVAEQVWYIVILYCILFVVQEGVSGSHKDMCKSSKVSKKVCAMMNDVGKKSTFVNVICCFIIFFLR